MALGSRWDIHQSQRFGTPGGHAPVPAIGTRGDGISTGVAEGSESSHRTPRTKMMATEAAIILVLLLPSL